MLNRTHTEWAVPFCCQPLHNQMFWSLIQSLSFWDVCIRCCWLFPAEIQKNVMKLKRSESEVCVCHFLSRYFFLFLSSYVMMMPFKRQALVEFSAVEIADRCVTCGAKEPVYIAGTFLCWDIFGELRLVWSAQLSLNLLQFFILSCKREIWDQH